uniref:SOWAHA-C winged helix-turn-helix domain-containing protein n=1 Tax=Stegastes partitus TaxID=144197 RepID=A0A3B4ZX60_9TELE
MDAVLTQDAVLHFLQSSGGSVKNADLLLHFRPFLRDHAERDRNRELFKKFVNSVATVRQTDGVSFVVLRKKFRGHVPGGGAEGGTSGAPRLHAGANGQRTPENAHRSPASHGGPAGQQPPEEPDVPKHGGRPGPAAPGGGGPAEPPPPDLLLSLVPLEPREHAWLVKGAAGAWPDIYSLFREDSSLLNKRDFISGFTVLHWIAKHGDHRFSFCVWLVLRFLSSHKVQLHSVSHTGHTPLHVAAIHGNRNIIRLLVGKFSADVRLRDTAGKRPWQYLSRTAPLDIFQLLGAPARAAVTGEGGVQRGDSSWEQQQQHQQQQRRRRRHHLSSASGQRPQTYTDAAKVKRSTSIAAFLKHKSLHRFHGHQSGSPL